MSVTESVVELRSPRLSTSELRALNVEFEHAPAETIVRWAAEAFGTRLVLTSSFADTVLIDVVHRVAPDIAVVFCDTGFHFAETYDTVKRAQRRYRLDLTVLRGGDATDLWAAGTDACCARRKVEPLDRHLRGHADAWLSGLRRADHPGRASTPVVELDSRGLVKINPLAAWSDEFTAAYTAGNNVIVNPLVAMGYDSIGCWPCTEQGMAPGSRSGRWAGSAKTECGIHV